MIEISYQEAAIFLKLIKQHDISQEEELVLERAIPYLEEEIARVAGKSRKMEPIPFDPNNPL